MIEFKESQGNQTPSQNDTDEASGAINSGMMMVAVVWGIAIVAALAIGCQAGYTAASHYWGPIPPYN